MANYVAPSKEIDFVLNKVLDYKKLNALSAFSEATPELTEAILDNAAKFAGEVIAPINRAGDVEGVKVQGSEVKTASGFVEAYRQFVDSEWLALAQNPSLILADEPIASLDPKTSHQVLSMLKDICKKDNISALTSLHQVDFAKEYGDRIIGLSHGKIVFNGKSDQLSDEILKNIYSSSPIAEEANFTSNEVVMV